MKIVAPSVDILTPIKSNEILKRIELCGRTCYKSEDKIADESAAEFVRGLIQRGHESVLEHVGLSVKFICDRGVSHEIVRHRLASYSQESTRYCNYSAERFNGEITVIEPCYIMPFTQVWEVWFNAMKQAENSYFRLLDLGCSPQEARSVLPNSLKTELVMTANIREWRHFLRLRTSPAAHPQMRELAKMLLAKLKYEKGVLVLFDDIEEGQA